ncbi:MAG: hypothetical protein IT269_07775 [Saprospiraceae bacterium]|nr:hypothetical protein [Saprospiraceae bacterium]
MQIVIETSDEKVVKAIVDFIKPLNVQSVRLQTAKIQPSKVAKNTIVKSKRTRNKEVEQVNSALAAAIQIVEKGCDMHQFGDAVQYQSSIRQDRELLF